MEPKVEYYDSNIARITYGNRKDSSLIIRSKQIKNEIQEVKVTYDGVSKKLLFTDPNGKTLLKEVNRAIIPVNILGEPTNHIEQEFELSKDEAIYGFGQHAGGNGLGQSFGLFNYRGSTIILSQRNTDIGIPFMVSSKGYGILWDNYSMMLINNRDDKLRIWFEAGDALDYYFIYGPELDRVIASYRRLTGDAPLLPKWAYGYWQSKERYASQNELLNTLDEFKKRNIPIDVIVLDWRYWGRYGWNAFKFDENDFPDPEGMINQVHEKKCRLVISIWPTFGKETEIYKEFESKGCIIQNTTAFNPFKDECRKLFWEHIKKSFFDIGVDGYWLDASEPETGYGLLFYSPLHDAKVNENYGFKYLNAFPLMETRAVYEGQRAVSNKRVVILTRSSFAGQQASSAISWSGDILSDWATLRGQIPAGLNFCLSGIPYWTTDIGGFFSGNPESQAYKEIFVRWFQWGVFCPIFRVHGTIFPKEPWRFGDFEKIIVKYINLRYRLLPYIYSLAWKVTSEGYTMMRALVMDFRDDSNVYNIDDQFMFGPYMLISPVTLPEVTEREIYLPKGRWYDFWTGRKVEGGRWLKVDSPIDIIPIHVKEGAIIPLASRDNSIEIRVYPGGKTNFLLYDDDGITYNYEKGDYSLIPLNLNNDYLTIGKRIGEYSVNKVFKIVSVREGIGIKEDKGDKIVEYNGDEIKVKIN
ncbi:alpha-xylosidase [Sulfolobus sp. B5]|nr:alpha-xylosidase [Sulfolobus sp. B5]